MRGITSDNNDIWFSQAGTQSIDTLGPNLLVSLVPDVDSITAGTTMGITINWRNTAQLPGGAINVALNTPLPGGPGIDWTVDSQDGTACSVHGVIGAQTLVCALSTMPQQTHYKVHVTSPTTTSTPRPLIPRQLR